MKHVSELYEQLVSQAQVRSIYRYNLRKFCRSFQLPPCGVSFWLLDDLNWDYLQQLNGAMNNDKFRFRGGENFPRAFFDHSFLGQTERTEYIFLTRHAGHHQAWQSFFSRHFSDSCRIFGQQQDASEGDLPSLVPFFKNALVSDLIHFGAHLSKLPILADFYLALVFLTGLPAIGDPSRDKVFQAFLTQHPAFRADLSRITTTTEPGERLDDVLYLLSKLQ